MSEEKLDDDRYMTAGFKVENSAILENMPKVVTLRRHNLYKSNHPDHGFQEIDDSRAFKTITLSDGSMWAQIKGPDSVDSVETKPPISIYAMCAKAFAHGAKRARDKGLG